MIVDRSAGLKLGQEVPLGTHGHKFTVVGLMSKEVTASGDPVGYITLRDAQGAAVRAGAAGRAARSPRAAARLQTNDQINAVIAKVSPYVPVKEVAAALSRWKHLTTLTQDQQETLLSKFVIEKARNQQRLIMVLLIIVSAVIIALIVYTLTMDKVRSIATLKFVGAPDRTIVGLIVQQALSMGIFGYFTGLALVLIFQPYFPRRLVLDPDERRHRVRHHRRDLPCRQHARHPAGAQGGPGGSAVGGGVSTMAETKPAGRARRTSVQAFRRGDARGSMPCVDIDMEVFPGQVVGLMGPSGSGKTTLLNCIACILEPSSGRLTLDGEVVYDDHWLQRRSAPAAARQGRLHLPIPQSAAVSRRHRQCRRGARSCRLSRRRRRARAPSTCSIISTSATASMRCRRSFPAAKPSGWRSPARSPTGRASFSPTSRPRRSIQARARIVMDLLRRIAVEQDAAIIVVTHDEMILDRFDHIFRLRDGRLESEAAERPPRSGAPAAAVPAE